MRESPGLYETLAQKPSASFHWGLRPTGAAKRQESGPDNSLSYPNRILLVHNGLGTLKEGLGALEAGLSSMDTLFSYVLRASQSPPDPKNKKVLIAG